jgi:diacylglycerol kinase (ATP)
VPTDRMISTNKARPVPHVASARDSATTGWVGVVANRNSGMGRGLRLVNRLVRALRRVGLSEQIAWTPEDRATLVSRSAVDPRCRCLVAVGGDGTVADVLNEQPSVPLTVLPAGTENLVAGHFGLRCDPDELAKTIAGGIAVRVDVGLVAGRRFLLMAGFGFDGDVVSRHHQGRVSRSGSIRPTHRIAYIWPVLRSSFSYRFPLITVRIVDNGAEEVLTGTTVFIFNAPCYALGLPFVPSARDDDGWLDVIVFRKPGPFQALYYLWKVFLGTHLDDPSVFHRRAKKVVVTSRHCIPVQIDGDPGGYLPAQTAADPAAGWSVEVIPAALDVIASASRRLRPARVPLASDGVAR